MANEKDYRSFWSLIKDFQIEIPLLQRDYVQGLELEKNKTVRKGLLNSISECLRENRQLSFDFIYGAKKQINDISIFYPLDGQQRLTTLFLLHWYLGVKEKYMLEPSTKDILKNFSYSSRASSRDFCENLVFSNFMIPDTDTISVDIRQSTWFHAQWDFDPTIKAMLVMLDAIHLEFRNIPQVFDRFTSNEISNIPIVFHCITLENLNLTDRIYIKMNARGKSLSAFESFKAWVFQTLQEKHFENELVIFREKIEKDWTDLFWRYKDVKTHNIDRPFMRYVNFISEMMLRTDEPNIKNDQVYDESTQTIRYELLEKLFVEEEKVQSIFDKISILSNNELAFAIELETLFTLNSSRQEKLKIFSSSTSNLLKKLLSPNQSLQNDEKTILYCAILRKLEFPEYLISLEYLRIIRNIISRIRQQLYDRYVTNFRAEDFFSIINFAKRLNEDKDAYSQLISLQNEKMSGIAPESFKEEIQKANLIKQYGKCFAKRIYELEDMDIFLGTLNNILGMLETNSEILYVFFDAIFQKNDISPGIVTRGLLSLENDAILLQVGWTQFGPRYVIRGKSGWYNFLTSPNGKIQPLLKQVFKRYDDNNKVVNGIFENIIEEKLANGIDGTVEYYLIKYPIALEESDKFVLPVRQALWFSQAHLMSGKNLVAWHANLIHFILESELYPNMDITSFSYGSEKNERIKLTNGISLMIEDNGWRVFWPETIEDSGRESLRSRVGVDQNDFLMVSTDEDVVSIGKELFKSLVDIRFEN